MRTKQKKWLAAVSGLLLLVCLGLMLGHYFISRYVLLFGDLYPRELQELRVPGPLPEDLGRFSRFTGLQLLDLRPAGASPEEYEELCRLLPDCSILWDLPFQGNYLSRSAETLTLSSLTEEEAALLDYLPNLTGVYAWDCRDYGALLALQRRRPECKVFYNVELGGQLYDCDTTRLTLRNIDEPELGTLLACLPRLQRVRFTGDIPEPELLRQLGRDLPEVDFSWEVTVEGKVLDSTLETLSLPDGGGRTIAQLDRLLHYFPALTRLDLGATEHPEEALLALERGHPGLTILWDMDILGKTYNRGAREIDLSGIPIPETGNLEARLALMPDLEKVIMSGCGLTNEEMDALDRRHPDTRFVWTVNLGGIPVRTDATWFCPNKYYIKVTDRDLEDLRYCYDMVCIDIGHNRGVTNCDWAANMPKLRYLVIADTNIKDLKPLAGLEELVFLEVFTAPVRDYTPLLECPALEDLNLGYTYGDPAPVLEMTWLKRLWWTGNPRGLPWSMRNQLRTTLPDTKMEFAAGSSTGAGWRQGAHYYAMRDMMGMPYMTG